MRIFLFVTVYLLRAIEIIIIARCIVSFIPNIRESKAAKLICWLSEPVLSPAKMLINKAMPNSQLPVDLSPIATYLAIIVVRVFIQSII